MGTALREQDRSAALFERLLPTEFMAGDLARLSERYQNAKPFPHICIDGLFDPQVLDQIHDDWPTKRGRDWIVWDTDNELKETSRGLTHLSLLTQTFLLQLCTPPFIDFLKTITGHEHLLPDPLFFGAGLMECFRGGWLDIHGDYTRHPILPLARRINVLIYVNRDWDPSWHGELELWDPQTKTSSASFLPEFNRTVIFNTTSDALHGHPARLACPDDRSRKVISVYYWSAAGEDVVKARPINFMNKQFPPVKSIVRRFVPPILIDLKNMAAGRKKKKASDRLYARTSAGQTSGTKDE